MTGAAVPTAALRLWRELAGGPDVLATGARTVVRGSRGLCPPGWTGVLRLGDAVVVEAGAASDAQLATLLALPDPLDVAAVDRVLPVRDRLGPAVLHYLPDDGSATGDVDTTRVAAVPATQLAAWLARQDADEVEQSGLDDADDVLLLRDGGDVLGAAVLHPWPCAVAHLGVLVDPAARGRGVGTTLGAAAVARALDRDLHPQWRAEVGNRGSRGIARRLGMVAVGCQLSLDLRT